MLWKVLISLCLLCLSGIALGEENFEYVGKRKLMSAVETDDNAINEEAVTEDVQGTVEPEMEIEQEENDKSKNAQPNTDGNSSMKRKTDDSILPWLKNVFIHLFTRNQPVQTVPATSWFKNFDPQKDLVVLVNGVSKEPNYVQDYFSTLKDALLNDSNYNIIALDWSKRSVPELSKADFAANLGFSAMLGHVLNFIFEKNFPEFFSGILNTYYIGHELGIIPLITFTDKYGPYFHYVYGLNPLKDLPHAYYHLTQEHGEVVSILTTNNFPYSYGHRNFYPISEKGPLPPVYKVLAKSIRRGWKTGTFCCSEEYFRLGYCKMLPQAPVWFTHSHLTERNYFVGRYYYYMKTEGRKCI